MKIAIALPVLDVMSTDCALSVMALAFRRVYDKRFDKRLADIALIHAKGSIIPHARRNLVEQSLAMGASHIFFIDSDIVLPIDALDRLLSHHKDIVLASYMRRYPERNGEHLIGLALTDGPKHPTLTPMATAPLGCALIRLSVFDAIAQPWFSYNFTGEPIEGIPCPASYDTPEPHRWTADTSDGVVRCAKCSMKQSEVPAYVADMSEDVNFCARAREAGFDIWLDPQLTKQIGHAGTVIHKYKDPTP